MKKKFLTLLFILIFVSTALISCYESIENLNSTSKSVESQGVEVFQSDSISWVRYSDENFSGLGYSPKAIGDIKSSQTFSLVPFGFEQDVKGLTFTLKENQASFWKQMQTSEAALIHANKKVVFKGFCGRGDNPGLVFQAVYFEMEGVKQAYAVIFSNKEDSVNKKHVICSIDHLEKTLNTKVFPKENLSSENGVVYIDLKLQMDSLTNKLSNAFKALDKGVSKTINGFEQSNSELYQVIDKRTERVGGSSALKDKADFIKFKSDELVSRLKDLKDQIIQLSGGVDDNGIPVAAKNEDFGYAYLTQNGRGDSVVFFINQFRDFIVNEFESDSAWTDMAIRYKIKLNTDDIVDPLNPNESSIGFVEAISKNIPLAALIANITLWQSYIKNAEADYLNYLTEKIINLSRAQNR